MASGQVPCCERCTAVLICPEQGSLWRPIIEELPMLRLTLAFAAIAVIAAPAGAATQCKDPKTKRFIKCPPAAAAAASGGVTKDKNGKCHVASGPNKGKFTKCP